MFFIAYAFKRHVHLFAGRVKVVSHSSCRTIAIFKYFCPLASQLIQSWEHNEAVDVTQIGKFKAKPECLTLSMLGNLSFFCCHPKLTFSQNSFKNTSRVSYSLDPVQVRHSVGHDLRPNCLQMLSADDKSGP